MLRLRAFELKTWYGLSEHSLVVVQGLREPHSITLDRPKRACTSYASRVLEAVCRCADGAYRNHTQSASGVGWSSFRPNAHGGAVAQGKSLQPRGHNLQVSCSTSLISSPDAGQPICARVSILGWPRSALWCFDATESRHALWRDWGLRLIQYLTKASCLPTY